MKYAVLFVVATCELFLLAQSEGGELKKNLFKNTDVCVKETNIGKELIDRMKESSQLIDDPNVKCFIKCLLVKSNIMSEGGELNEDAIKMIVTAANSKVDVQKCLSIKKPDACETAFAVAKCFME